MNKKIVLTIILMFALIILTSCSTETTMDDKNETITKEKETSSVDDSSDAETTTNNDESTDNTNEETDVEKPLAKDFELMNLKGEKVSLSDYKGQKIFLNFWASWCGPCREEMPDLNSFYESHKDENFVIIAVNVGEDKEIAESFMTDNGYTMPVLLDETTDVAAEYLVRGIPTTLVINESFEVIHRVSGTLSMDQIEEFYEKFNQKNGN